MKLSVQDLNSHYGPAHILFDVALEVGEGEVVALLGRNGAGKSTTFRSIVGLVESRTGRILFEGKDVSREPTHAMPHWRAFSAQSCAARDITRWPMALSPSINAVAARCSATRMLGRKLMPPLRMRLT